MAQLQIPTLPFSHQRLPRLHNGRRYSHEIPNPTSIPTSKRADVLQLLRSYFDAVRVNGFTMSESSRTSAPAPSEASTGTSITEMTFNFSVNNGTAQREPTKKRLEDVQRTRKALMRKLEACPEDCRMRKVKCKLWHHALRELLEVSQNSEDEAIVEWALRLDIEPENPQTETPVSARVASLVAGETSESREVVVDRVNNILGMSPAIPTIYSSNILETEATLLESYGRDSTRSPIPSLSPAAEGASLQIYYSTLRDDKMFCFGLEDDRSITPQYKCQFEGCTEILPALPLASHYGIKHHLFEHLHNPLRMGCQKCNHFQNRRTDRCLRCNNSGIVEAVFGRFIPMDGQDGMLVGRISDYAPFGNAYQYHPRGIGSHSFMDVSGRFGSYGNSRTGQTLTPGGSGYSYTNVIVNHLKQSLRLSIFYSKLPYRLLCRLFRGRRHLLIYVCGVVLLLATGYRKQDLLLSKTPRLMHAMSTSLRNQLPRLGVILAFVTFTLHRIIMHAHHTPGGRCSGWLSRCAINMFNSAYGRQAPAQIEYWLGRPRE